MNQHLTQNGRQALLRLQNAIPDVSFVGSGAETQLRAPHNIGGRTRAVAYPPEAVSYLPDDSRVVHDLRAIAATAKALTDQP